LSGVVGNQQLLLKQASVEQVLHKKFHHVGAVFYHLDLLLMYLVCSKEINQDVCEVNYAVQRRHHLVRHVGGKQTEKVVFRLKRAYLLKAG
jgi:hypothetical protein